MRHRHRKVVTLCILAFYGAVGCTGVPPGETGSVDQGETEEALDIDLRSYRLGGIGAFAEMVGADVKELALSSPMTPAEVEGLLAEAERIAAENGAELYRETDFLVTDLFSSDLTEGLEVLVIYKGETLDRYLALKAEKERLELEGQYVGEARLGIAQRFGAMLSYPEARIRELLQQEETEF